MKAAITKIDQSQNNASVTVTFELKQDDGKPIGTFTRGFVSLGKTDAECLAYFKQSLLNVGNAEIAENQSKLKDEVTKLVGTEIQL